MPSPTTTLSTLERELGLFVEARKEDLTMEFVADRLLPPMTVSKPSWTFKKIPLEELLRLEPDLRRAPGAGYKRSVTRFTQDSFTCEEYGYEEPMDRREQSMYSSFLDAAMVAADRLSLAIMVAREMRVAALLTNASVYTGALAQAVGNGQWSTVATSTPILDVKNAKDKFFANTGYWPNTVVMSRQVANFVKLNAGVIAALTASGAGDRSTIKDITAQQLAAVFDVEQVLIAGGGKNTAVYGATPVVGSIWPDSVQVCRVARTNDVQEPCIGRTFVYAEDGAGLGTTDVYYEPQTRSDVVRYRQDVDEKLMYNEFGVMIPDVLA